MSTQSLAPQLAARAAALVEPSGRPAPIACSMPPSLATLRSPVQEDGRLTLTAPIPTSVRADLLARVAALRSSLSDHATARTAAAVVGRLRSMPRRSDEEISAAVLADVWMLALGDPEMTGIIPGWVMEDVCRAYLTGKHGKWMPSPAEFVDACKATILPLRRAEWEMQRHLDAPVVAERTAAEREAMKARVAELVRKFNEKEKI